MSERIKRLYPEAIKAHNEHPYHFSKKDGVPAVKAYNPVCGDKFELYIQSGDGLLGDINFQGFGCAISKASTSILAKVLEGKKFDDALLLCDNFLRFINDEAETREPILNDEFNCFSAIHEFPERRECASLAWTEIRKFLESKSKEKR